MPSQPLFISVSLSVKNLHPEENSLRSEPDLDDYKLPDDWC